MEQTGGEGVADVALNKWLRMDLCARHGAVAAAPVPHGLIRPARDFRSSAWVAPAPLARSRRAEDGDAAFGVALAVLLSGLFWAILATAVWSLWG